MTTIAYKDGIIAWDSRMTRGETIVDDDCQKRKVKDGVSFILSGDVSAIEKFVENYPDDPKEGDGFNGLIVGEIIQQICRNSEGYFEISFDPKVHNAWGSGQDHAFTAMDMGASAKEAVKMAMKRDKNTGGRIRTMMIKNKGK